MAKHLFAALIGLCSLLGMALPPGGAEISAPFPRAAAGWRAEGALQVYDRATVYDYLDGGAEVYLEYGLRRLLVQRYVRQGESPVVFDLFEMDSPAGAFGAFTFEREDEEARIGQGSEYGGGLLRFWQGRYFGFVQAEVETPSSRTAVLTLGRAVARSLGPSSPAPGVPSALPPHGLRPLSVRFVLSPLLLQIREPRMQGNPLGLSARCEAVVARYGEQASPERVVIARFSDAAAARNGAESFVRTVRPEGVAGEAWEEGGSWSAAASSEVFAVVVLGAPSAAAAEERLKEAAERAGKVKP